MFRSQVFLTVLALTVSPAAAVTLTNGDFETGNLTGWEVSQNEAPSNFLDVTVFDVDGDGDASLAYDAWGAEGGISRISQDVFLIAGSEYLVSWEQAFYNAGPNNLVHFGSIEVRLGGQLVHITTHGTLNSGSAATASESETGSIGRHRAISPCGASVAANGRTSSTTSTTTEACSAAFASAA